MVGVKSTYKTHGGRHQGTLEAEAHGLDPGNLARLGRWNHDKMSIYYLSGLAIPGAHTAAGFLPQESYTLDRDVIPPLDLQQQIFPEIESKYPGETRWLEDCVEAMTGVERSGKDIAAAILNKSVPVSLDASTTTHSANDVAKHGVLQLFLQLRRIILQDAVMFIAAGAGDAPVLQHPIFHSPEFLAWKDVMLAKMADAPSALRQFTDVAPDVVRVLETQNRDVFAEFQNIRRRHEAESLRFLHQEETVKQNYESLCVMVKGLQEQMDNMARFMEAMGQTEKLHEQQQRRRVQIVVSALAPGSSVMFTPESNAPMTASPFPASGSTTPSPATQQRGETAQSHIPVPHHNGSFPVTPFKFSDSIGTISDVLSEIVRFQVFKQLNPKLGYDHDDIKRRTVERNYSNKMPVLREIIYIQEQRGVSREDATAELHERFIASRETMPAFQTKLRTEQGIRDPSKNRGKKATTIS